MGKKRTMFQSRKQQNDATTTRVLDLVSKVFPNLLDVDTNSSQVELTGLAVNPSKSGEGYLCVVRLRIPEDSDAVELVGQLDGTRFVVFGFGETPLEAVCNVEAQLENGTASLVKDRFAD